MRSKLDKPGITTTVYTSRREATSGRRGSAGKTAVTGLAGSAFGSLSAFGQTKPASTASAFDSLGRPENLPDEIAQQLRARILNESLAPGQRLPTEQELGAQFGVSRNVVREAKEVLESLNRRIEELDQQINSSQLEQETRIRASTKRDVTERFIRAVEDEQEQRRTNPALKAAAGESLSRTFLELARHRLPGATFDSLLQEAVCILELETGLKGGADDASDNREQASADAASDLSDSNLDDSGDTPGMSFDGDGPSGDGAGPTLAARPLAPRNFNVVRHAASPEPDRQPLPVVLSPDPSPNLARPSHP